MEGQWRGSGRDEGYVLASYYDRDAGRHEVILTKKTLVRMGVCCGAITLLLACIFILRGCGHEQTLVPQCLPSVSTYSNSRDCTSTLEHWTKEVEYRENQISRNEDPSLLCKLDSSTHRIECGTHAKCMGSGSYDYNHKETEYTYDCPALCGSTETMLRSCCNTCESAKAAMGQSGGELHHVALPGQEEHIHCLGCDQRRLSSEPRKLQMGNCEIVNGEFICNRSDACSVGKPERSHEEWSCRVLPCDKCTDSYLGALCCKTCLETKCRGMSRMACLGCDLPSSSAHHTASDESLPITSPSPATSPSPEMTPAMAGGNGPSLEHSTTGLPGFSPVISPQSHRPMLQGRILQTWGLLIFLIICGVFVVSVLTYLALKRYDNACPDPEEEQLPFPNHVHHVVTPQVYMDPRLTSPRREPQVYMDPRLPSPRRDWVQATGHGAFIPHK